MPTRAEVAAIQRITHSLYEVMPGAEQPGHVDIGDGFHVKAWGEVENTDHYAFCNCIATLIVKHSAVTFVEPD